MKPIIFSSDAVRAILEGRKTVTRQVINPQPERAHMVLDCNEKERAFEFMCGNYKNGVFRDWSEMVKVPYWTNDILYVQEVWRSARLDIDTYFLGTCVSGESYRGFNYESDMGWYFPDRPAKDNTEFREVYPTATGKKWHHPQDMPIEAARLFLRVTDIHPERLNSMILEDVEKEVLELLDDNILNLSCMSDELWNRWINTWNSTIKPADLPTYGWDADPWVWVIQFERISEGEAKGER